MHQFIVGMVNEPEHQLLIRQYMPKETSVLPSWIPEFRFSRTQHSPAAKMWRAAALSLSAWQKGASHDRISNSQA